MPFWYSNGTVTTKGAMSKMPMQHDFCNKNTAVFIADSGVFWIKNKFDEWLPVYNPFLVITELYGNEFSKGARNGFVFVTVRPAVAG